MNIYLVRNGEYAENTGLLTKVGLNEAQKASESIVKAGACSFNTLILASPQPRAIETAKLIARATNTCRFKVAPWLDVDKEGEYIFNEGIPMIAGKYPHITNVVLVTHQPNIAAFALKTGHSGFILMTSHIETGDVFEIDLMESKIRELIIPDEVEKIIAIPRLAEAFAA